MVNLSQNYTEHHLPYEMAQCCMPPDTGKRAQLYPQPDRSVLDLLTPKG